jgi:lipid II:glycine glycyltransferase (peptidoglycan interpeptide bridge formation enzyme)
VAASLRLAEAADLEGWDARAVEPPGGHVEQSRAWARHRQRHGWTPLFLVVDDHFPVLALTRRWRVVGGSSAYLSRGPVPTGDATSTATRLVEVTSWLAANGVDVVATDAEVPADTGYPALVQAAGFRIIEEVHANRHRLDLALPRPGDEDAAFRGFSSATRGRIRQAQRQGVVVVRLDAAADKAAVEAALEILYGVLRETSLRRRFWLSDRETFMSWQTEALAARLAFVLVASDADGDPLAAASFYRHGDRLTFALSGERSETRRSHPGAMRLLLWEAIQVAIAESRRVMDLGGVDVRGARRRPLPEEPEYGLLQFKESFGAQWVEMTGAHERVIRPGRYLAGRIVDRVARLAGRSSR